MRTVTTMVAVLLVLAVGVACWLVLAEPRTDPGGPPRRSPAAEPAERAWARLAIVMLNLDETLCRG